MDFYFLSMRVTVILICIYSLLNIDLLIIDGCYWAAKFYSLFKKKPQRLNYENMIATPEKKLAVIVSCWQQFDVIEAMLKHNIYSIDYKNYDFFVTAHTNDLETILAIKTTARSLPNIHVVVNPEPGPQNHASNFNAAYQYIKNYADENKLQYEAAIIHYADEVIHPQAFRIYNLILNDHQVIQLPITQVKILQPTLINSLIRIIRAEAILKNEPIVCGMKGLLDMSGGGIAYRQDVMQRLADAHSNKPFKAYAFTSGFDPQIAIKNLGFKITYALLYHLKTIWRYRGNHLSQPIASIKAEPAITLEKATLTRNDYIWQTAYRFYVQVTKEWLVASRGGFAKLYACYTVYRKLIQSILMPFLYLSLIMVIAVVIFYKKIDISQGEQLVFLTGLCLGLNRLFHQWYSAVRFEGMKAGWLALFLVPYQHYTNFQIFNFFVKLCFSDGLEKELITMMKNKKKTFALTPVLDRGANKLGNLLVEHALINIEQLQRALAIQSKTGSRLGHILIQNNSIDRAQLTKFLAKQFDIPMIQSKHARTLRADELSLLAVESYRKLIENKNFPIAVEEDEITIVVNDPSNDLELASIISLAGSYKVNFVLVQD